MRNPEQGFHTKTDGNAERVQGHARCGADEYARGAVQADDLNNLMLRFDAWWRSLLRKG